MKILSYDGPIMRFFDKVGSIMLINILFVLTCIPIFTVGAATTAMYRCFLTMAEGNENGLIRLYFSAFKTNFKKATILWLCVLPVLALVSYEAILYYSGFIVQSTLYCVLFSAPFVLVMCVVSYIFPLQAQFENTILGTFKNAAIFSYTQFPITITITAANLIFPVTLYFFTNLFVDMLLVWFLFAFGFIAFFNTTILNILFRQYFPKEELESTEE